MFFSCVVQEKAIKLLCAAAMVAAACTTPCLRAQAAPASPAPAHAAPAGNIQKLDEVIRQILAKDGMYSRTTWTANNTYKSVNERKFSVSEANGCRLIVVSDVHTHTEFPAQNRVTDHDWSDIFRPDFAHLDVSRITVADPEPRQPQWEAKGYLVRIPVVLGDPQIVASNVDKQTNKAQDLPRVPALTVYVSSREAADRLAKAFGELATACKANPGGF